MVMVTMIPAQEKLNHQPVLLIRPVGSCVSMCLY
jgi:hypothetical protein